VKITISYDTSSVDDLLLKAEMELDKVIYDLDSPEWYWTKSEWNKLKIQKVALCKRIDSYLQMLDSYSTIE
jgi:uncharacterized protein YdcH (DUF465 family)